MSFGPCPQVLLSEVDSSSWGRTASSGARMDTSLQESGGRHSLAGLRGKRDGASIGTRACCAGKEGRSGSRHPVPVHFCRELAGATQTRVPRVQAAPGIGTHLGRVCTPARNSGQTGTGRRPRGTRLPPVRGQAANSPLMCTGGTPRRYTCGRNVRDPVNWAAKCTRPGTRLPRACADPRNSAATCTGRINSGPTCTDDRHPNALLAKSTVGAKPAIRRQGRAYAFAQVRPHVVACQVDAIPRRRPRPRYAAALASVSRPACGRCARCEITSIATPATTSGIDRH